MERFPEWANYIIESQLNFMSDDDDKIFIIRNKKIIFKGTCEKLKIKSPDLLEQRIVEWDVRFIKRVRKKLIVAVV